MKTRSKHSKTSPDNAEESTPQDEVKDDKDVTKTAEEQDAPEDSSGASREEKRDAEEKTPGVGETDQPGATSAVPVPPAVQPYPPIQPHPHYPPHYPPYPYYMYPPIAPGPPLNPVEEPTYVDASTAPDPAPDKRRNRGGVSEPFPDKLHRMLDWAEREGLSDIVSFFPHGRAFAIHKPKRFSAEVMPKFFRQSRLSSYQRQLNLYGFIRINQGPDSGGYYHELFLKGRPGLSVNMQRTKVKGDLRVDKREPDGEPNFYAMAPVTTSSSGAPPAPAGDDGAVAEAAAEAPIAPASPAPAGPAPTPDPDPAGPAPAPASTPSAASSPPSKTAPPPMASPTHPVPPPPPAFYYPHYPYPPHPAPYTAAQQSGSAVVYYPYPAYYLPYPPPPNPASAPAPAPNPSGAPTPATAPGDSSAECSDTKGAGEKSTEPVSESAEAAGGQTLETNLEVESAKV